MELEWYRELERGGGQLSSQARSCLKWALGKSPLNRVRRSIFPSQHRLSSLLDSMSGSRVNFSPITGPPVAKWWIAGMSKPPVGTPVGPKAALWFLHSSRSGSKDKAQPVLESLEVSWGKSARRLSCPMSPGSLLCLSPAILSVWSRLCTGHCLIQ